MASPMERNQKVDEILMSPKVSFSSTLYEQSFSAATRRRTFDGKLPIYNDPLKLAQKDVSVILCTLQLTCSCHCGWPSSFLPSHVASKRAQGSFSSEVPWVPEAFHSRFPVSVKSCLRPLAEHEAPRRTREKTSAIPSVAVKAIF